MYTLKTCMRGSTTSWCQLCETGAPMARFKLREPGPGREMCLWAAPCTCAWRPCWQQQSALSVLDTSVQGVPLRCWTPRFERVYMYHNLLQLTRLLQKWPHLTPLHHKHLLTVLTCILALPFRTTLYMHRPPPATGVARN